MLRLVFYIGSTSSLDMSVDTLLYQTDTSERFFFFFFFIFSLFFTPFVLLFLWEECRLKQARFRTPYGVRDLSFFSVLPQFSMNYRSALFFYGGHGLPSRVFFSSFEVGYFEMIAYIKQPHFFLLFFTSHLSHPRVHWFRSPSFLPLPSRPSP